ncbi:DNA-directed RNA polymerase subunit A' [Candidatus Micrarchaeota archaeon]|nr:DNA-directed RNA polymerase subunit A' [Candidatus Micrarchaeota archaeon]
MMEIQKVLDKIKFSLFSPEMVRKMSAAKIIVPDTYDDDGYPIDGGLVDTRLGIVDPGLRCKTCGGRVKECPGHFGHIELVRPIAHVEFAKHILYALKLSCSNCHRIVSKESIKEVEKEVETLDTVAPVVPAVPPLTSAPVLQEIAATPVVAGVSEKELASVIKEEREGSKKERKKKVAKKCPRCDTQLPEIKFLKPSTFYKDKEVLLPTEIKDWLSAIPDDDLKQLGCDPNYSRIDWAILTVLPVPPVNVRPSITLETGERSEDDLTHKLVDIIRINQKLEANINAGAPQLIIEDLWELLQYHITTYFNNETANIPPARHRSGRPLKTLAQRLKGKEGRFRYNLSGKRVNFSARTVISPDPRIAIDEVGVPTAIAKELTVPVTITEWNMEECKKFVAANEYPKATYIIRPDGKRVKVGESEEMKKELIDNIKIGQTMERQLTDGDLVIFNRQPSLHRVSMMAHRVRVFPGKTFRLNPIVVAPYNADFDGDEMNMHAMQTEEAQAEAKYLMKVEDQILSPRHGHAIIKPQEDHVSGLYFLTQDETDFSTEEASNMLYSVGITELPASDKKGRYSGKLIFSQILPKDINVKIQSKMGEEILIKNGLVIKGAIESKAIESEVLERIFAMHGAEFTKHFLAKATRLALQYISQYGLSVSLKDYSVSKKAEEHITKVTDRMNREVDNLIMQYKNKTLERSPGVSIKETLESSIVQITSKIRDEVGKIVEDDLTKSNTSIIMAKIGARGSLLNAIQMSALVAQQTVRNKRIKRGYNSSFRKGMTVYEFMAHSVGGREALVNTAIRTARSGYMQRRLINALQDLVVYEDLTVRNTDLSIVQFIYGADGCDPMVSSKAEVVETAKQDDVDTA